MIPHKYGIEIFKLFNNWYTNENIFLTVIETLPKKSKKTPIRPRLKRKKMYLSSKMKARSFLLVGYLHMDLKGLGFNEDKM